MSDASTSTSGNSSGGLVWRLTGNSNGAGSHSAGPLLGGLLGGSRVAHCAAPYEQPLIQQPSMSAIGADGAPVPGAMPPSQLPPSGSLSDPNAGLLQPSPVDLPPVNVSNNPPPTRRSNPGPMDRADGLAKRILNVDVVDGARFELQQPLGNQFATIHTVTLGAPGQPNNPRDPGNNTYQFGANLAIGDSFFIVRMDQDARMDAQWHGSSGPRVSHKVQASIGRTPHEDMVLADAEFRGDDFTMGAKISSGGSTPGTTLGLSYFQSVTPRWALGAEWVHHGNYGITYTQGRGRYTDNNITATFTANTLGTLASTFHRRVTDRVGLAAELDLHPGQREAHSSLGMEVLLRQAKLQINVSSTGGVNGMVQDYLTPAISVALSASLNHWHDYHRFGIAVQWG